MKDIFAEAKRQLNIKDVVQRYASVEFNRNNQCCCPIHNEKTPSFTVYPKTNTFKCFGCSVSGDCVGFVAKLKDISNIDAVKLLQQDFGLKLHHEQGFNVAKITKIQGFKNYIEQCKKDVEKTDYFKSRGLTTETINRFNLGYDEKRKQVVVPYNRKLSYYQARSITEKKFFKPKYEVAGNEAIYNEEILSERDNREPIFIVESPICAMSIMQLGGKAIATCGGSGTNKLSEKLKKIKSKPRFIISLDNDDGGKAATKELISLLNKEKIKNIDYCISGVEKDPNELLMKSAVQLKQNIATAREQFFKRTTDFGELVSLTEIMATNFPSKEWLIEGMICGGLGLLVAPPKTGKSFFALDMCLSIASGVPFLGFETSKQSVWYMAMEDEPASIKERASKVWKNKPFPKNIRLSFKDNYRLTSKNLSASDKDDPDVLKSLTDYIETVLYADPSIKLIVIDTFQLVRSEETKGENIYKGEYRETRILKNFITKHKVCIILVHHTRKGKDEGNEFNEVSGSTALTGGVDFALLIKKKKVSDSDATLKLLSRNVWLEDQSIYFDRENCRWIRIGSEKEQAEQKTKDQYNKNDFRKTILHLLEAGGGNWQGTMSELVEECGKLLGHSPSIVQPTQVSREIHRLEPLLLLHDNVKHAEPNKHGGKLGRQHRFYYKHKEIKQQSITI